MEFHTRRPMIPYHACSYQVMHSCWQEAPESRPSFSDLAATLAKHNPSLATDKLQSMKKMRTSMYFSAVPSSSHLRSSLTALSDNVYASPQDSVGDEEDEEPTNYGSQYVSSEDKSAPEDQKLYEDEVGSTSVQMSVLLNYFALLRDALFHYLRVQTEVQKLEQFCLSHESCATGAGRLMPLFF